MYDYRNELPHVKTPAPRGIRNNNPGNIEAGQPWQGLAMPSEYLPDQQNESRFAVFVHPKYGVRALVKLLRTYQDKYGLATIQQIIGRYAPTSENLTTAYAVAVATHVDCGINDRIDMSNDIVARRMVEAIIRHENGMQPYPDHVITDGLMLANMLTNSPAPPAPPVPPVQPAPPVQPKEPDEWVRDDNGNWLPVYYDNSNPPIYHRQTPPGSNKVQGEIEQSQIYKLVARLVPPGYGTYLTALVGGVVGLLDVAHDTFGLPPMPFVDYSIDGGQWIFFSAGLAFLRRAKS